MEYTTKLLATEFVTHDTKNFIFEKPETLNFTPGQAIELHINLPKWKEENRPFTFTSLPNEKVIQLTIKEYPEHNGVTQKLHTLKPGAEITISKPFGAIQYTGKGVFIAGGTGITPFLAIFRSLKSKNKLKGSKLLFSNKTQSDIIKEKELKNYFRDDAVFTLTREEIGTYEQGRIDQAFLEKYIEDYTQNFYICGPWGMVEDIQEILKDLGANSESVVVEE